MQVGIAGTTRLRPTEKARVGLWTPRSQQKSLSARWARRRPARANRCKWTLSRSKGTDMQSDYGASQSGITPPRQPRQITPGFPDAPGTSYGSSPQHSTREAAERAVDPVDQAKKTLSRTAGQVGEKVSSSFDVQKGKVAAGLGSVARALRAGGDQLRAQDAEASIPGYVASAASQVERLSGYLKSTDAKAIVGNVEDFARRQPALFIGGAFFLGILGARFLKSSGESIAGRSVAGRSAGGE